jgi:hypothetical protein
MSAFFFFDGGQLRNKYYNLIKYVSLFPVISLKMPPYVDSQLESEHVHNLADCERRPSVQVASKLIDAARKVGPKAHRFALCAEEVASGTPGADTSTNLSDLRQPQRASEAQLAIPMQTTVLLLLTEYMSSFVPGGYAACVDRERLAVLNVVLLARQSELRKRQTSSQHARVRKCCGIGRRQLAHLFS